MNRERIIEYLRGENDIELFERSSAIRVQNVGTKVYLRGLIELSNICSRDCLYCGIRASNSCVQRYTLNNSQITEATKYAYQNGWGSVVVQSGEVRSQLFTQRVSDIIRVIKEVSNGKLAITLSCGEQSDEVYREWKEAGAERYLLRIESSNKELFEKIHPSSISFEHRLESIHTLQRLGYQTGSGVMIGLPFQTIENLADDLLWLRDNNIVMVGMGPYLEHHQTPLFAQESQYSRDERLKLTLRMIALLRILMPKINIASSTALSTLCSEARYLAMQIGANVLMPNITPNSERKHYNLYENKSSDLDLSRFDIAYNQTGASLAFIDPKSL